MWNHKSNHNGNLPFYAKNIVKIVLVTVINVNFHDIFFVTAAAEWLKGIVHPKMKILIIFSLSYWWKIRWSLLVHVTPLELHRKEALQLYWPFTRIQIKKRITSCDTTSKPFSCETPVVFCKWGWVDNDWVVILGWTIPLSVIHANSCYFAPLSYIKSTTQP